LRAAQRGIVGVTRNRAGSDPGVTHNSTGAPKQLSYEGNDDAVPEEVTTA